MLVASVRSGSSSMTRSCLRRGAMRLESERARERASAREQLRGRAGGHFAIRGEGVSKKALDRRAAQAKSERPCAPSSPCSPCLTFAPLLSLLLFPFSGYGEVSASLRCLFECRGKTSPFFARPLGVLPGRAAEGTGRGGRVEKGAFHGWLNGRDWLVLLLSLSLLRNCRELCPYLRKIRGTRRS